MKINPKYGDRIISIPGTAVLEHLTDASCEELRVLIFALANQSAVMEEYEAGTGLSREQITDALTLWREKGVMTCQGLKDAKKASDNSGIHTEKKTESTVSAAPDKGKRAKAIPVSSDLPAYSSEQINRILEKNKETKFLIDSCQQTLGKIFSIHEVEVILKLRDYLSLGEDYILLLCSHCAKIKKTSLRYVEKTAVALFDEGITEYGQLERHLEELDAAYGLEGKFRKLLGIGDRALIKKEKDALLRWTKLGLSWEVIEKAFEVTAENTKKFSLNYMSAVLESWYKDGLLTLKDVEAAGEKYKAGKESKKSASEKKGSFDEDDFFAAALKRSYDD